MKKIIILLCLAILGVTAFASCTPGGENTPGSNNEGTECQHPVSAEWTTSETHHWHVATCEHGEQRVDYAEHADADEDGVCDVCAYEVGHIHSYTTKWVYDVNNHWKAATCTHKNETDGLSLHSDANYDGKCDVCPAHVHVLDSNGKCTVCDEQVKSVDHSNLSSVISAITGGFSKVNGGKITSTFTGRYGNSSHSTKSAQIIDYLFGKGSSYYKIASAAEVHSADQSGVEYVANTTNLLEKWYNLEADKSVFGVYRNTVNGVAGELNIDSANANVLSGYYYQVSTLAKGYGAEGIIASLYEASQANSASDFVVEHIEGSMSYKFSFNSTLVNTTSVSSGTGEALGINVNVNYFEVAVEFSYNGNYSVTDLNIVCDCYTSDAGSNLVKNEETGELENVLDEANVDLDYDASTGTVVLREGALADTYTFTVEQTVGDRTYVNEYTKDSFTPSSFEVYSDRDGTVVCADTVTISLTNLPEDEYYPYVRFRVMSTEDGKIFTDSDEIVFTSSNDAGLKFASYDPVRVMGSFLAKTAGTYTVTVSVNGSARTFTVIVTP